MKIFISTSNTGERTIKLEYDVFRNLERDIVSQLKYANSDFIRSFFTWYVNYFGKGEVDLKFKDGNPFLIGPVTFVKNVLTAFGKIKNPEKYLRDNDVTEGYVSNRTFKLADKLRKQLTTYFGRVDKDTYASIYKIIDSSSYAQAEHKIKETNFYVFPKKKDIPLSVRGNAVKEIKTNLLAFIHSAFKDGMNKETIFNLVRLGDD